MVNPVGPRIHQREGVKPRRSTLAAFLSVASVLVAGCVAPDGAEQEDGPTPVFLTGDSAFFSPSVVCPGDRSCLATLPTYDWGTFEVESRGTNATLEVLWAAFGSVPPDAEVDVWVHRVDGGTWGGPVNGTTPLTVPLVDLSPGTYRVVLHPYSTLPYAGPYDIAAHWQVAYNAWPDATAK